MKFICRIQPTTVCRECDAGWKFAHDEIESPQPLFMKGGKKSAGNVTLIGKGSIGIESPKPYLQ